MKIYTKFGDRGQTALFDGTRVGKDHLRIETYGTVDELNSVIGVAIAQCAHERVTGVLTRVQHELFVLGSDLATPPQPAGSKNEGKVRRIGAEEVAGLEREIDAATAELPALKNFILPGGGGGSVAAAQLHVARTVCRRAERCLVALLRASVGDAEKSAAEIGGEGNHALVYLNRLSDLLFTLARLANKLEGRGDVEWDGGAGV